MDHYIFLVSLLNANRQLNGKDMSLVINDIDINLQVYLKIQFNFRATPIQGNSDMIRVKMFY